MGAFGEAVRALALLAGLGLAACTTAELPPGQAVLPAVPFITKETGHLTMERQQFIDTWASAQVLFDGYIAQARTICAGPCADRVRCAQLPDVEAQGKVIKMTVDAKIRNPEATIDWANVAKILGLIAKMVL